MTITTVIDLIEYSGTGSAPQDYAVPFVFWKNSELLVTHLTNIAAGSVTSATLVEITNYTVTGGSGSTGTINVTTPTIETDELLLIQRVLPLTQILTFDGSGAFPTDDAQEAADRCVAVAQQVDGELSVNIDLVTDTDLALQTLTVEEELDGGLVDFDVTKSALYNILGAFQITGSTTASTPVIFHLHIGPLGTIGDPELVKRIIFFQGIVADTDYTFTLSWLNFFLSKGQKVTFGVDSRFSLVTIKAASSIRIVEYVEKT